MGVRYSIFWLTGNSGAGKTTLANGLEQYINEELTANSPLARRLIVLDGDDMRAAISENAGFSREDRRHHNLRVARLAGHLQHRGFLVVVAVIAPYEAVRQEIDAICHPQWIYVKRAGLETPDRPYEVPQEPKCIINTDQLTISEAVQALKHRVLKAASA